MKRFTIYLILSLVVIELCGYALSMLNIEPTGYRPFLNAESLDSRNGYADRDSLVGVWHLPNDAWVQNGACFTTEMYSNQFGARDNKWDTTQKGNLFLGSSFIEGFGIPYGKRLSEKFEELTNREVFNCGMGGDFSPVQYYLTVKKFNNIIKFDTCFVFFILPTDDSLITEKDDRRYRPYLTDTGIAYTKSHALYPERKTSSQKAQLFFSQFSYIYHLYLYFKSRNFLKSRLLAKEQHTEAEYPNIKRIMSMFCKDYPDKFFYFVFAPTLNLSNIPHNLIVEKNMKIIDLRGVLDYKADYFNCNSHWNSCGHEKIASSLYRAVYNK